MPVPALARHILTRHSRRADFVGMPAILRYSVADVRALPVDQKGRDADRIEGADRHPGAALRHRLLHPHRRQRVPRPHREQLAVALFGPPVGFGAQRRQPDQQPLAFDERRLASVGAVPAADMLLIFIAAAMPARDVVMRLAQNLERPARHGDAPVDLGPPPLDLEELALIGRVMIRSATRSVTGNRAGFRLPPYNGIRCSGA